MKNLFLPTVLFSFAGALGVKNTNITEITLITIFLLIILLPLAYFLQLYWQKYSLGIYSLIFINTFKLNRQIERNKKDVKKLKKKIARTRQKLFGVENIDDDILKITDENIKLWHNQVVVHGRIIDLCEIRTSSLAQNWDELNLLQHLIKQTKKERNPERKLKQLAKLIDELDGKVSLKISKEIDKLIQELKTTSRKGKILRLETRIETLESKARSAVMRSNQLGAA